jgi:hypothetical protein
MHARRKHDYLEVDLEFREHGNLEVSMVKYLKNIIEGFPEMIAGRLPTLAGDRLFDVRDDKDVKPLDKERAMTFHHTTAQLLFLQQEHAKIYKEQLLFWQQGSRNLMRIIGENWKEYYNTWMGKNI